MCPLAQADGHDGPWLLDELVPGVAAVVEDVVVGAEDAIGKPVGAHVLPDVLDRIELGRFRRQRQEGDVAGNRELMGEMPAGLVEQQDGMSAGRHRAGDFGEVQGHGGGVAERQDETGGGAARRADRAEDIGRLRALVVRRRWPGAAPGPAPGDLVLLPDPGLILEPHFYGFARRLSPGDLIQAREEVFLNASRASGFWA